MQTLARGRLWPSKIRLITPQKFGISGKDNSLKWKNGIPNRLKFGIQTTTTKKQLKKQIEGETEGGQGGVYWKKEEKMVNLVVRYWENRLLVIDLSKSLSC